VPQTMSVEERLARVEAKQEIRELMAGYAFGCDNHDAERFLSIWTDDAYWYLGGPFGEASGTDAIKEVLDKIWVESPETHHWITDVTVGFTDEASATGEAHTICYIKGASGDQLFVSCDYDNKYEQHDGRWLVSSCVLDVHWWKGLPFEDLG
jgi:uncharacterized protein (TIGR02246 family)